MAKLHYDEKALHADYTKVFGWMMTALLVGIGGAVAYFFVLMVYLGGWSHEPTTDYAEVFNERYPIDYKGLKLPIYGGPAEPVAKEEGH